MHLEVRSRTGQLQLEHDQSKRTQEKLASTEAARTLLLAVNFDAVDADYNHLTRMKYCCELRQAKSAIVSDGVEEPVREIIVTRAAIHDNHDTHV
eukprot:939724-Pleurochrysis_carterae.AAC.3